jgi:hypothetical protein
VLQNAEADAARSLAVQLKARGEREMRVHAKLQVVEVLRRGVA